MYADKTADDKGKNKMKCEKSGEGSIVYGKAPSESGHNIFAYNGNGGYKVCNYSRASEGYLSPRENISEKCGSLDCE